VRVLARLASRDLEVRQHHRDRRAQLMRGIGCELSLRTDASFDPLERSVQRDGQIVERVAVRSDRQALVQALAGQARSCRDHLVEPIGRRARQSPADQQRKSDADRQRERESDRHLLDDLDRRIVGRRGR